MKIYFYPHNYLRDRQLDTVRCWPKEEVINPGIAENRQGAQVSEAEANSKKIQISWKQKLPLMNVKLRSQSIPKNAIVYVWGGLIASGKFIVDIDNPWALVGYNLKAMPIYRWFIKRILLSKRCLEIRCMSNACRNSLKYLFGEEVYKKSAIHYPIMKSKLLAMEKRSASEECRFLFVGTQFELKGGPALLRAFKSVYERNSKCRLDVITHLPEEFEAEASVCKGIQVHAANFSRDEVHSQFMSKADVLVFPTYGESFGMVALEALAHDMAIISNDVYALNELVDDGRNGNLLQPPISVWNGVVPSNHQYDKLNYKRRVQNTDTTAYEKELESTMLRFVVDPEWRRKARAASRRLMQERFAC